MAEALAKNLKFKGQSAGTNPGEKKTENAVKVINELGIKMKNQFPKSIDTIETKGYDVISSMGCGVECPNLPISYDWGLDDPVGHNINFYINNREKSQSLLEKLSETQTDA